MFDCKRNFPNQYKDDLSCRVCKDISSIESEDHLLLCKELNNEKYDVKFSHVFANTEQQHKAIIAFKKFCKEEKNISIHSTINLPDDQVVSV